MKPGHREVWVHDAGVCIHSMLATGRTWDHGFGPGQVSLLASHE